MVRAANGRPDWPSLVRAGLARRPTLDQLLGSQLIERAGQADGLLNPLVRSLCGESPDADVWEQIVGRLRPEDLEVLDPIGVGPGFDQRLQDRLAEFRAIDTFTSAGLGIRVKPIRRRSARSADFAATWMGKTAIVEVKRDQGLADELLTAKSALRAARMLHADVELPAIVVEGTEQYHRLNLEGALRGSVRDRIRTDLGELLRAGRYRAFASALAAGRVAPLGDGMLVAKVSRYPRDSGNRIDVQPFPPNVDSGVSNCMQSLRGLSSLAFKVRSALPQLAASAGEVGPQAVWVAYVYYDAWEMFGLNLRPLAGVLSELLQWNARVSVIVDQIDRDRWFFGRNRRGQMEGFQRMWDWARYVGS